MRDHELEDIYDRLYKLSVALAETVAIVKELQSDVKKKVDRVRIQKTIIQKLFCCQHK